MPDAPLKPTPRRSQHSLERRQTQVRIRFVALLRRFPHFTDREATAIREALSDLWDDGQSDGWYGGRRAMQEDSE